MKKASSPSDDPNHDKTDTQAFLNEVSRLVITSMEPDGQYDPNMRAAAVSAMVLGLWYGRLGYAKVHAPARPVSVRIRAYHKWLAWVQALVSIPVDESEDETFFTGQGWDFPFSINAKSGDFL